MEFEQFLEEMGESVAKRSEEYAKVELRMLSASTNLSLDRCRPTCGLYFLTGEDVNFLVKDGCEVNTPYMANRHFAATAEPDISFSSRKLPFVSGYEATRNHDGYYMHGEGRGYTVTRSGVDEIVYRDSIKTGEEVAKHFDAGFVDNTSRDLLKLKGHVSNLENKFWNYSERAGD